jgi:hypothetical protein
MYSSKSARAKRRAKRYSEGVGWIKVMAFARQSLRSVSGAKQGSPPLPQSLIRLLEASPCAFRGEEVFRENFLDKAPAKGE